MDDLADDVYYRGRCTEFSEIRKFTENNITIRKPFAWINRFLWLLRDGILWFLTGYGVRVKRLIFFILAILVAGTIVFHQPEVVVLKSGINLTSVIQPQDSYWESFWISLNLFLPIEIPSGSYWIPSQNFAIFGTLLKMVGWILVPIGIAGITGILKRKP